MPKKSQNRFRLKQKPYLFDVPREMRKVKLWAFTAGILNAFNSWGMRPESESEQFISAAAISSALLYEEIVYKGKQGTNDGPLFRKTFSDFCALIHPAVTRMFVKYPEAYKTLLGLSEEKRNALAYTLADQYLDGVETMIAAGEPIVFDM